MFLDILEFRCCCNINALLKQSIHSHTIKEKKKTIISNSIKVDEGKRGEVEVGYQKWTNKIPNDNIINFAKVDKGWKGGGVRPL